MAMVSQPPRISASDATMSSHRERARRGPEAGSCPALFVVMSSDDPRALGSRHLLRNVDSVVIDRGPSRAARRLTDKGERQLRIDLPDRRVSGAHARLEHVIGNWMIVDLGSKNGLFVDGERLDRGTITDGQWIAVGHTFLRFRQDVPAAMDAPLDLDAGEAQGPVPDLRTLVPGFQAEIDKLRRIAATTVPVLIGGETGSGKEVVARALHVLSGRPGPFVAVNCGAIPASLVESTLFGHRRGAFSGAIEDRFGLVRSAEGGILLLDEIGDLPPGPQAALLRVLQEKEVVPVGDARPQKVNVRFVAATHHDLDTLALKSGFRADLLARLAGLRLAVPPLRERLEDLGILIASVLARTPGAATCSFAPEAVWALCRHSWPMNVRELEQSLTSAAALSAYGRIQLEHLPDALRAPPAVRSQHETSRREELVGCLREHAGNLAAVARALGTSRTQIHRLLERYGIDPRAYR